MLIYDDTAAEAISAAAEEAQRAGASRYGSEHVLLGLLRSAAPVTRLVTRDHPQLSTDNVRTAVLDSGPASGEGDGSSTPMPGPEFRRVMSHLTAKWRPLVRSRQLQPGPKLSSGDLWLAVLEPSASSARILSALGADPEEIRPTVLTTMVPEGRPVPDWPGEARTGAIERLLTRLLERLRSARR